MSTPLFQHYMAFITAKIDMKAPNGTNTSIGTGFFYSVPVYKDQSILLLISNKHVFIDPNGEITVSLNRKIDNDTPEYGNIRTFNQTGFANEYYAHPNNDIDLACINVSQMGKTDCFYKCLNNEFLEPINYENVTTGDDVIFVGYPENRYDMVNNLPLIRKGSIASMPNIDFNGKGQIVIDAQVFPGSSGSPVFVISDNYYRLLGVVSETMIRHSQLQTLPTNMPLVGVQQMLGLGIVIKQKHIQELIDHTVNEFLQKHPEPQSQEL